MEGDGIVFGKAFYDKLAELVLSSSGKKGNMRYNVGFDKDQFVYTLTWKDLSHSEQCRLRLECLGAFHKELACDGNLKSFIAGENYVSFYAECPALIQLKRTIN